MELLVGQPWNMTSDSEEIYRSVAKWIGPILCLTGNGCNAERRNVEDAARYAVSKGEAVDLVQRVCLSDYLNSCRQDEGHESRMKEFTIKSLGLIGVKAISF